MKIENIETVKKMIEKRENLNAILSGTEKDAGNILIRGTDEGAFMLVTPEDVDFYKGLKDLIAKEIATTDTALEAL